MTTIVIKQTEEGWDLAADGRITRGDEIVTDKANKIFKIPNGYIAAAGSTEDCYAAVEWFNQGQDPNNKPKIKKFNSVVIDDGVPYMVDSNLVFVPIEDDFYATGFGWVPAMAALKCGMSARDAIKIASSLSVSTGGRIKVVKVVV